MPSDAEHRLHPLHLRGGLEGLDALDLAVRPDEADRRADQAAVALGVLGHGGEDQAPVEQRGGVGEAQAHVLAERAEVVTRAPPPRARRRAGARPPDGRARRAATARRWRARCPARCRAGAGGRWSPCTGAPSTLRPGSSSRAPGRAARARRARARRRGGRRGRAAHTTPQWRLAFEPDSSASSAPCGAPGKPGRSGERLEVGLARLALLVVVGQVAAEAGARGGRGRRRPPGRRRGPGRRRPRRRGSRPCARDRRPPRRRAGRPPPGPTAG